MKKFERLNKKNDIFRAIMCLREKKLGFCVKKMRKMEEIGFGTYDLCVKITHGPWCKFIHVTTRAFKLPRKIFTTIYATT